MNVSPAFQAFAQEAPQHQQAWSEAVQALQARPARSTTRPPLAYLAVMAAARLDSGLPFHVKMAKITAVAARRGDQRGAHRAAGRRRNVDRVALPAVLEAYDEE